MEVVIAAAALGLVSAAILQSTVAIERARRATMRADYASRELDNLIERFVNQPWDAITQSAADRLQPDEAVAAHLPNASLETLVLQQSEPLDAKRITMQLRWRSQPATKEHSLALTAWVFRPQEGAP